MAYYLHVYSAVVEINELVLVKISGVTLCVEYLLANNLNAFFFNIIAYGIALFLLHVAVGLSVVARHHDRCDNYHE